MAEVAEAPNKVWQRALVLNIDIILPTDWDWTLAHVSAYNNTFWCVYSALRLNKMPQYNY